MENPNWPQLTQNILRWRRHLHRHPELSHQEHHTLRYLRTELAAFPELHIDYVKGGGLVARLKTPHPGPVIALRADIDALPLQEQVASDFASQTPGVMHACGHDCHTAMLLGAIAALYPQRDRLSGTFIFIFQVGEEMPPGGAKALVDSGLLNDAQLFFALHLDPLLSGGKLRIKPGVATANRDTFTIRVLGRGGHSAMPHTCRDPLVAAAALVSALQTVVAREIDPEETAIISLCSLICGDGTIARLPDSAELCGTVRNFSDRVQNDIRAAITRISSQVCAALRCEAEVTFSSWDYRAVHNHPDLSRLALSAARDALGEENVIEAGRPECVGEDFSEYQRVAPSCFAWLGAGTAGGENAPLHNVRFCPDESALPLGVRYYLAVIEQVLRQYQAE
ncbi:M20 metallopeptidase family protein [Enterobacillus tribolii]|uniref:N-acetyldiaminopimelate deacetylase n=1 Tax=Enterobacillus tribolii TaxID=1487935 RepID=A0A370R4W0_9GAMM|nr:amidohydrolase [Enterobacillus tribolii]RDK97446.1 N-acetyldiaminopimelate deacetylase [Enterobacillus tribolii]